MKNNNGIISHQPSAISHQPSIFRHKIQNSPNVDSLIFLTVTVNVLIPKAGFKIAGIPITLGNILLFLLLIRTCMKPFRIKIKDKNFIFLFLLFPLYCFLRILIPIISGTVKVSNALPPMASNSIYPLIFLVIITKIRNEHQIETLTKVITNCLFITMIYDIFQAIFGIAAVQIPGITVNYSDYANAPGHWWLLKYNGGSDSSKIFSTYQNGNLYGVNMLMFYPLFSLYFRKNKGILICALMVVLFSIIVFLTGSRTVWIGALVYSCLLAFESIRYSKIKLKSLMVIIISLSFFAFSIGYFMSMFSTRMGRVFYSLNWSVFLAGAGRTEGAIRSFQWLFDDGNILHFLFGSYGTGGHAGAYEMTYFAIFFGYGIIGLILWLLPIVVVSLRIKQKSVRTKDILLEGVYRGIFIYMACAFIEGGWWLPPTAINLWTLIALAYKKM